MINVLATLFPRLALAFAKELQGPLRFEIPVLRRLASNPAGPAVESGQQSLPTVRETGKQGLPEMADRSSGQPDILTHGPHALPADLQSRTSVVAVQKDIWWERVLRSCHLNGLANRSLALRRAWALFRKAPGFKVVITTGALEGLAFAYLQKLRGPRRSLHVMYDCLWYGGNLLKRAWMHSCLKQIDCCVVWASVERTRYANAYGTVPDKFVFIPHHHSLLRYSFQIGDDGYLFTGGNSDRDYGPFFEALRDLPIPCTMAITRPQLLAGLQVPPNVRIVSATSSEFRQLIARSRMVVVAMRANLLRTGGQQTFLNAMYMGKPVVLVDPEGGVDYIEHGKTGLLVPFGDAASLRKAISYLWENPEEARAMGERARDAAVPLSTERCNVEIWNLAIRLLSSERGAD